MATLTLTNNPNFSSLFNSIRTYFIASLGSFDLNQYDDLADWQRAYALFMHISVLITFMLIIVNLLIAILSDEYASLNEVKTGLYWSAIIQEMPKYAYDK